MKKIFNHLVLAFIFITQMMYLQGCSHNTEVFKASCDCGAQKFECTSNERTLNVKGQ